MFDFNLPLENYFIPILCNYSIENAEAKQFWEEMKKNKTNEASPLVRSQLYIGLQLLVRFGYLKAVPSPYHSGVFLYSKTEKLIEHAQRFLAEQATEIYDEENALIQTELDKLSAQTEFLEQMLSKHPICCSIIRALKADLEAKNQNYQMKKELLNSFHSKVEEMK